MSRSSRIYQRQRIKRIFEESSDFLDFNQFGPEAGVDDVGEKSMTLDDFVNLPLFSVENLQKAIIALKNHEEITLQHDNDSVKMSSKDDDTVHIEYADIALDFDKNDLLNAMQGNIDLEIVESVETDVDKTKEEEMPSVLKFKEFLEIEKNTAKQDGKDSF